MGRLVTLTFDNGPTPGVTDGVTGVANAWRANSPILVFGGQGPFANLRRGSLQEMDHLGVVRPITKYCDAVYQTKRIPEYVELAIRHAVSGIPGPAYLEIPMDIFMGQVEAETAPIPRIRTRAPRISPDRDEVRAAIELLRSARRPMLRTSASTCWLRVLAGSLGVKVNSTGPSCRATGSAFASCGAGMAKARHSASAEAEARRALNELRSLRFMVHPARWSTGVVGNYNTKIRPVKHRRPN